MVDSPSNCAITSVGLLCPICSFYSRSRQDLEDYMQSTYIEQRYVPRSFRCDLLALVGPNAIQMTNEDTWSDLTRAWVPHL